MFEDMLCFLSFSLFFGVKYIFYQSLKHLRLKRSLPHQPTDSEARRPTDPQACCACALEPGTGVSVYWSAEQIAL